MKQASKVMYLLGKIFTILDIVGSALGILGGVGAVLEPQKVYDALVNYNMAENITGPADVQRLGVTLIVGCVVALMLAVVVLTLIDRAVKYLDENKKNNKLHIALIVLGLFVDLFVLLGGAFALGVPDKTDEPEKKSE